MDDTIRIILIIILGSRYTNNIVQKLRWNYLDKIKYNTNIYYSKPI